MIHHGNRAGTPLYSRDVMHVYEDFAYFSLNTHTNS